MSDEIYNVALWTYFLIFNIMPFYLEMTILRKKVAKSARVGQQVYLKKNPNLPSPKNQNRMHIRKTANFPFIICS
ncbi:MAG: hypothetical protein WC806_02540 [Candidatus Gracilibacteria bacterium]|jgi:hypothetical protein